MPKDGYPTEEDLALLHTFTGTWREYMAYIRSISNYWSAPNPWGWTEEDSADRGERIYSISTGGWSGNEDIIRVLIDEPLWSIYWEESRRGGHYKIAIPLDQIDNPTWHINTEVSAPNAIT